MPVGNQDGLGLSPVPRSVIAPTSAPGLRGPHGLSPRQNYSRVNSGAPDSLDAGGLSQKAIMPKVGSVMSQISMATRPRALNDMLKTAMESALSRAKIAEEAQRQLENIGEDDRSESTEHQASSKCASAESLSTDYVLKLAAATDYIVELLKEGTVSVGEGPGALQVTQTTPDGPPYVIHTNSGQAATNKPETPGLQKAHPQEHEATQLANDKDRAPGAGDKPVSGSTKNASAPVGLLRKMAGQSRASASEPATLVRALLKQAEDAINPARISAGTSGQTLETSVTGQPGPAASGKDRVPATAQGVADMTRREAKSVPKQEMGALLDEPMMSASHDTVLQQAFSHTNEAGAKISSAQHVKVAAARALLRNLVAGG